MNNRILSLVATCLLLTLNPLYSLAQTENDSIPVAETDSIGKQSYEEYLDSLFHATYPDLREIHTEQEIESTGESVTIRDVGNSHVPYSVSIDMSKAVGEIPIESGTTPTGAKTYNVPINAYHADGMFSPQLSLAYNSQQANGVLGIGWSVGGLQAITRGNKSVYFDNSASGMKMDETDAFFLNGTRLILLSSTSSERQYESETGHIKVTGYFSGHVLKYFKAFFPNGSQATFGFSWNTSNQFTYPVSELTDGKGNTINYGYSFLSNVYYISSVTYGYGYSVSFEYSTDRPDALLCYHNGSELIENHRIQSVKCYSGNTLLNTYTLSYSIQNNVSVLTEIGYSANGSSLNPLRFYYGSDAPDGFNTSSGHFSDAYDISESSEVVALRGRFDYASADDGIICYPNYNPYHYTVFPGIGQFYINDYDNSNAHSIIYLYSNLRNSYVTPMSNLSTGTGFIRMLCADLRGQQEEYPIKINNVAEGNNDKVTFTVYRKNANGNMAYHYSRSFSLQTLLSNNNGTKSIHPKFYYTGDFNGDGKAEVLAMSAHNPFGGTSNPSRCCIFDLENNVLRFNAPILEYVKSLTGAGTSDILEAFDYDGDGRTDLCHISQSGVRFYSFKDWGSGWTCEPNPNTYAALTSDNINDRQLLFGDFNGDGLVDILLTPFLSNDTFTWTSWYMYFNRGDGNFSLSFIDGPTYTEGMSYLVQDFDNDGTSDVICKDGTALNYYHIWNGHSMGATAMTLPEEESCLVPVSISASTSSHVLLCFKGTDIRKISYKKNSRNELLATGMANSLGVIERNAYEVITYNPSTETYTRSSDETDVFPFVKLMEPVTVLAETETYKANTKLDRNEYIYTDAYAHRQGLGFCGFTEIDVFNFKGQHTTTTYDPFHFGNVISVESPASTANYTYATTVQGNRIRHNNLTTSVETDLLKSVTWTTAYTYNNYDYPATVSRSSTGYSVTTQYTYNPQTDTEERYQLDIIDAQSETTNKGTTYQTVSTTVTARNEDYLPTAVTKKVNGITSEQVAMTYNSHGQVTSKSTTRFNSTDALTVTNTYNISLQLASTTDALGNTTSYTYDTYGNTITRTDNTGTATFTYDSFGRMTQEQLPDGTVNNTYYEWRTTPTDACYCISRISTASPTVTTVYDAQNREIRSSEKLYNGSFVNHDKKYDKYGRLWRESLPFTGSALVWNTYSYDSYDRVTQAVKATGQTVTYSYSGNAVTENNGQNAVTRSYDAMGRLVEVEDNAGTVAYTLHANGNPLSINALGNTVTFNYDIIGRRTVMNDPSHGTTTYQYDSSGNTSQITDANGNVTQMTYDAYGRMLTKANTEFTTTYAYNDTFNKLASATSTNNTSKTFTYDSYGRLAVSREYAASTVWFQQTHSYDNTGKLASTSYESNNGELGTESFIYTNQNLSEVQWQDSTIFRITGVEHHGLPSSVTTGPLNRMYGYSASAQPTSRVVVAGPNVLQNQIYSYSTTSGNLTMRRNNLTNTSETFTYDALDRLTSYGGISVTYDDYGNITSKGDVGTYGYNRTDKPFAVTDVTLSNDSLSALSDQTVTYTSFNRPKTIEGDNYTATFTYNDSYERVRMNITNSLIGPIIGPIHGVSSSSPDAEAQSVIQDGNCILRYYLGGKYEYESGQIAQTERLYLNGDYYSATAVFVKTKHTGIHGLSDITEPSDIMVNATKIKPISLVTTSLRYIVRDHLGSITHVIREDGTVIQELSYDAWGRLRDPQTHEVYAPGSEPTLVLGRGYCGHEHIKLFGLINMNARLYDPVLGRFLSPDPYVQMPDYSQNYNRYSYCMNNPLMYNDKTGEYFGLDDLIAGVVGGIINLGANLLSGSIDDVWEGLAAFGAGAVAGIGALYPEAGGWLWGGAVVGATNSWIAGGSIGDMLLNATIGAISSFAGGLAGQWAAKNVGGFIINNLQIESPLLGGVVDGAVTGAASGYASGSVAGLLYTGDFSKAHKMGISGLSTGGITGGISGGFSALRYCRQNNINPLTGKHECPYYMTEKEFLKSYNHSNSNKHPTNKLFGITDDALKLHILDLIEENSYLLHQNQNTLRVDINNIPMIFRVNVDGLTIRSFDLFQYNGGYIRSATPVYYLPNQYW